MQQDDGVAHLYLSTHSVFDTKKKGGEREHICMSHLYLTLVYTGKKSSVQGIGGDNRFLVCTHWAPTYSRAFLDSCDMSGATDVGFESRAAQRDATRCDATRPFDVELALLGGRDNVACEFTHPLRLSRPISLFRIQTRDERVADSRDVNGIGEFIQRCNLYSCYHTKNTIILAPCDL